VLNRIRSTVRALLDRETFENTMADELRFHVSARVDDLVRSGVSRSEAERRAHVEFSGVETVKEQCRQARGLRLFDELRQDLRYGTRALAKSPAFTATAVLTLALGLGAVTVIYSVVYNVAIAPLPYRDADRLVNVFVIDTQTNRSRGNFAIPELLDLHDQSSVFEDVVGTLTVGMSYETPDRVEYVRAVWVTPNFFEFMGLKPLLGRAIDAQDGRSDAPPVAVLRHRAWLTYFAGDPAVVGTTVVLNGEPRTIVGVMPPRFTWNAADLWIPGSLDRAAPAEPTTFRFQARLKPGVTSHQAEAQLNVIAARRARTHPNDYPGKFQMSVVNVIEYTVGPFSGVLYTALAAVGLLLLIACCNVANMLLARATTREREMMVRAALGASRGRMVRQLMVESVLLAAGGAAAGALLAHAGIGAIVSRLPQNPLPGEVDIALNTPVLVFSLGVAALSAILFGLTPALYSARRDLVDGLKSGGKGIASGRSRLRSGLVAAEIALSLVLVLSAGLLMRTFASTTRVDLGFSPDKLLLVPVAFPPASYTTASEKQRFYHDSLERIVSLPGISAAAASTGIPPFDAGVPSAVELVGSAGTTHTAASVQLVTADYFRTVGIPFARGAPFRDVPVAEMPTVAAVNQTFVNQYLGGQDPVGKRIRIAPLAGLEDFTRHGTFEIVAEVRDVKNQGLRQPVQPQIYLPWSSAGRLRPVMLVRAAGDPRSAVNPIRHELAQVDRQVAVVQPGTLAEALDRSFYAEPRFSLMVLGIFATTATVLVAVGVFSVMAYTVSRQKKDIAVRMALGASRGHVFRVVFRSGTHLLAAGAGIGLLASLATNRLLASQLWNVSPQDPLTLAAALALISTVALAACYLPARRAMRVDPIGALREE
jgi:putative ABC transport system permease protein